MRVKYDEEADAIYFYFLDTKIVDSDEVAPGIICDFDENDRVVGVEVLNWSRTSSSEITNLICTEDFLISFTDKQELQHYLSESFAVT
jgi:uncharacterized protein YuzE